MGANPVKKPQTKGKNRIRLGETFGTKMSVACFKTWPRCWRTAFPVGGKAKKHEE